MEVNEIKRRVNFDNKVVVNNKNSGRRMIRLQLKNSNYILGIMPLVTSKRAESKKL